MATARKVTQVEPTTVPIAEVGTLDAVLTAQVVGVIKSATYSTFSTGSDGFRGTGKATNTNGHRYQVSVMLVRIGSKDAPAV